MPMKQITIPTAQYHDYQTASQLLARSLGPLAPSVAALIRHELSHRCPQLIADEYLDSIGLGRARPQARPRVTAAPKRMALGTALQCDPSRN